MTVRKFRMPGQLVLAGTLNTCMYSYVTGTYEDLSNLRVVMHL
jgi:hypothetical protein